MRSVCVPGAFSTGLTRTPSSCCFSALIFTLPGDMEAELRPESAGPPCECAGPDGIPESGAIPGASGLCAGCAGSACWTISRAPGVVGVTALRWLYQDPATNAPAIDNNRTMEYAAFLMEDPSTISGSRAHSAGDARKNVAKDETLHSKKRSSPEWSWAMAHPCIMKVGYHWGAPAAWQRR